ncbi:hypothetical protein NW754_002396 [Fusarium falciforme]|uniref:Uncharacterized protein n=1 Tax=Fusarium falciforme TaxID=195108 RepID=A0A9W8QYI3_9HYPO|nr:hypothetical protein NW754_002396 [Fusarium falciforme]KAJ4180436.1 hypothetical protein NW755_011731 [Fusarium falciforme]KAJ4196274.1 hypothetical protein NW767_009394 [Fusarium falciforme]KAJ4240392.1 hypothetical protein NW757_012464 [Fusarium falciforme]
MSSPGWMQKHRHLIGDRILSQICLPSAHDAGTYHLRFGTVGGGKNVVLTQTKSMLDQLHLGVRHLDIRATYAFLSDSFQRPLSGTQTGWYCGHYTPEGQKFGVGWQGGSGASIDELVEQVNEYTRCHAELVIIKISHVVVLRHSKLWATEDSLTPDHVTSLLTSLGQLNHLFTVRNASGGKEKALHDYTLNEFVGNGQAAVVVVIEDLDKISADVTFEHGFWPRTSISFNQESVTHTQGAKEAIFSLLLSRNNNFTVLKLAKAVQQKRFPWLLQDLANYELTKSLIEMDKIENADLLTFCLASTIYRLYRDNRQEKQPVIVYGGTLVTDPALQARVQVAINQGESLAVDNQNFIDTWHGMPKSCAVLYSQNDIIKGRWARELSVLHFEHDILHLKHGGKEILTQRQYLDLLKASVEMPRVNISNLTVVGGDEKDPQKEVRKTCVIRYRLPNDREIHEESVLEGNYLVWRRC